MTANEPEVPLVEADRIVKRFGAAVVLDELSVRVAEQDVVCLIGSSGSGKSTFLRCVNGLEPVESGEIRLRGERISGRGVDLDRVRRRIGIVFQAYNLFPHMTVLDNVVLAPHRATKAAAAAAVLAKGGGPREPREGDGADDAPPAEAADTTAE